MVQVLAQICRMKPFSSPEETISALDENGRKQRSGKPKQLVKQRSSIMSAILTLFYRAYCLARLTEMRRHHLDR
jgi:hypothetical protein